jgi:thiopeptide-type bacteriocin biosynthesis protein
VISLRRVFIAAGIEALEVKPEASKWIHFGLKTVESRIQADLYGRLAHLARQMLQDGTITNFFFMHKPPGMRIRFEIPGANRDMRLHFLRDHLSRWQREGVIEGIIDGVYEPEARLFGGPVSMRSVHALFTADSFAWVDYNVLAHNKRNVGPAWVLSLLMLRALFGGLGITDWEDIGVWDTIRSKLGRNLRDGALSEPEFTESAAGIRDLWAAPRSFLDGSFPDLPAISDDFERSAVSTASNWRTEYFAAGDACIGPRAAAALFAIFHWNRAGLSSVRQAIIAEALARRGPS